MIAINWQTAPHSTNANARVADVYIGAASYRLYVRRAHKHSRDFVASINAMPIRGAWSSIDGACAAVASRFRAMYESE